MFYPSSQIQKKDKVLRILVQKSATSNKWSIPTLTCSKNSTETSVTTSIILADVNRDFIKPISLGIYNKSSEIIFAYYVLAPYEYLSDSKQTEYQWVDVNELLTTDFLFGSSIEKDSLGVNEASMSYKPHSFPPALSNTLNIPLSKINMTESNVELLEETINVVRNLRGVSFIETILKMLDKQFTIMDAEYVAKLFLPKLEHRKTHMFFRYFREITSDDQDTKRYLKPSINIKIVGYEEDPYKKKRGKAAAIYEIEHASISSNES